MTGSRAGKRYIWTADDYEQLERLNSYRLPSHVIGELMNPPASGAAVLDAARRAGYSIRGGRGRPSKLEAVRIATVRAELLGGRAVREARAEVRARLVEVAAQHGYDVDIRALRRAL